MSLETNIPLALARLDTPNIFRYTLLYATLILEKAVHALQIMLNSSCPTDHAPQFMPNSSSSIRVVLTCVVKDKHSQSSRDTI